MSSSFRFWIRLAWIYHGAMTLALIWPIQALVNSPFPLILGLPRQLAWCAAWIIGSILVLWRLDAARAQALDESDVN